MKRSIILVVCAMSWLFVANTHAAVSHQPQKRVHNKIDASEDKETVFVTSLMQKMTLAEKIGQLSQYVGGELLTGPQSDALSDSLLCMVWWVLSSMWVALKNCENCRKRTCNYRG